METHRFQVKRPLLREACYARPCEQSIGCDPGTSASARVVRRLPALSPLFAGDWRCGAWTVLRAPIGSHRWRRLRGSALCLGRGYGCRDGGGNRSPRRSPCFLAVLRSAKQFCSAIAKDICCRVLAVAIASLAGVLRSPKQLCRTCQGHLQSGDCCDTREGANIQEKNKKSKSKGKKKEKKNGGGRPGASAHGGGARCGIVHTCGEYQTVGQRAGRQRGGRARCRIAHRRRGALIVRARSLPGGEGGRAGRCLPSCRAERPRQVQSAARTTR